MTASIQSNLPTVPRPATSPVLVTGGTGTLGRAVVARLGALGHTVRVLSRHAGAPHADVQFVTGDLATGAGVDEAVASADIIIHCAGSARNDDVKARHLVRNAARAGARHLVYISVVGADRVPVMSAVDRAMFGYFESKLAAERVVAESGIPWTTLRATQFYELTLLTVRAMAKLPIIPVPSGTRFQPVETQEVAERLVDLALGSPAGLVADIAGPRIYTLADLLRSYLHARGLRRLLVPVRLPGKGAAAIRAGANLAPDRATGKRTWDDFLKASIT